MKPPNQERTMDILLADDGSKHSQAAVALLGNLPLARTGSVTVLAVMPPRPLKDEGEMLETIENTQRVLREKGFEVATKILHGHPAAVLTQYAKKHTPNLMVLGAKGLRATLGIFLGGVAQQLVEYASWPVLIVRAPFTRLRRVYLVIDGSPYSKRACDFLAEFKLPTGIDLRVIHVLPPYMPSDMVTRSWPVGAEVWPALPAQPVEDINNWQKQEEKEGRALLDQTIRTLEPLGVKITSELLRGDAATEIIAYVKANKVDLLVAGSRGLSSLQGWLLGSVSRKLVHYAGCSVLIVKEPG